MNILGIDYGKKRIGLAWVQSGLDVVLPFGQITMQDTHSTIRELADLISKENIDKVVVGLPLGMEGEENENTERVRKFVGELEKQIEIPVEFFDERFSSRQADAMGGDASRDEKAAMVILQSYIDKV